MAGNGFLQPEEIYLFNQGELFHSYMKFGAHRTELNNQWGVHFAVWAPNAMSVSVVGTFNNWHGHGHRMERQGNTGVWTLFVPGLGEWELYKYEILTRKGETLHKADPFAFYGEKRPMTASVVCSLDGYDWQDGEWMNLRGSGRAMEKPMLIYELHLASWRPDRSYRDLAVELVDYVKEMGFTHIELLPVMEHPYDGSWGYQITGYFGATSRYGTPKDLMYLIDRCHQAGIGVILDWVPGHFCKDAHGLGNFDGTPLFEYSEHGVWGTYKFNFRRSQVWSFLISNGLFWFDKFHVDGLRVDGVSSMLMPEHPEDGEDHGRRENTAAANFLRKLNETIFHYYPKALMIAEESTDRPFVTRPPYDGGLGFNYKWNMGWMNDTLKYMETDFPYRKHNHELLTFSMVYAFAENFILPLSHDEVVHGKKSLIGRQPGDYWRKFAGLRALYLYQICLPGKKLLFMGGELAQFIEWKYYEPLEWFLLDFEMHQKYHKYTKTLNHFYQREKSLWQNDHDWKGFEWIDADNRDQGILIFMRKSFDEKDFLIVVINFTPETYTDYRIGVIGEGFYEEVLNTDGAEFGGSGQLNHKTIKPEKVTWHNRKYSVCVTIPPLGGVILKPVYRI